MQDRIVAPSRVRGLKPLSLSKLPPAWLSRTFTGAWIETLGGAHLLIIFSVAPSRVRGLKQRLQLIYRLSQHVAPSRVRGLKQQPPQIDKI